MAVTVIIFLLFFSMTLAASPRQVANITIEHPGFVSLMKLSNQSKTPGWSLIVSAFNGFPFSKDSVSLISGIENLDSKGPYSVSIDTLTTSLSWPNEAKPIPYEVFNRSDMIIVPSGFLVPTKSNGALSVIDLNGDRTPHQIDTDGTWFYHRVQWVDMNGDGKLDALTCRAKKPLFGSASGEMIWFEQPDFDIPWTRGWQGTVIAQPGVPALLAPDTFFRYENLTLPDKRNIAVIFTAGFFSQSLSVWWRNTESSAWRYDSVQTAVIDNTEGPVFEVIYADMNGDGVKDLLVTYNKAKNGTVFVYELNDDVRKPGYIAKHMLMSGIDPAKSGVGKGAPGSPKLLRTHPRDNKPVIILSGDDNGDLTLLTPLVQADPKIWFYTSTKITSASPGTLGAIAVADINNDGFDEIFAPFYDDKLIMMLTFKPADL